MSSINRTRKNSLSPNSSNSNGSSVHENMSLPTIETINNPKWTFHTPTSSRNSPRGHYFSNDFGSRYDYANTRTSFVSSYSSGGASDRLIYPPSQRSSSVYTYAQSGFTTEHNDQKRSQKSRTQNRPLSTIVYHSTAQEAPAPLFDPFILMDHKVEPRTYNLIIRQSPMHGQMCTLGSKERRILDPLPIVQLDIRDKNGKRDLIGQASPLLIMQVNLIAEQIEVGNYSKTFERNESGSGTSNSPIEMRQTISPSNNTTYNRIGLPGFASMIEPTTTTTPPTDSDSQLLPKPHETHFSALRLLEGKLTASPHIVKDVENHLDVRERIGSDSQKRQKGENDLNNPKRRSSMPFPSTMISNESIDEIQEDQKACFFIFTDLSIRLRGTFRLEFSLIKLGLPFSTTTTTKTMNNHLAGEIVARIKSEPFSIFHARDFAGMTESTPLAKSLAMQGVHIPIRNDSRWKGRLQTQQQQQQQTRTNKSSTEDNSPSSASLTTARSSSTPKSNLKSQ